MVTSGSNTATSCILVTDVTHVTDVTQCNRCNSCNLFRSPLLPGRIFDGIDDVRIARTTAQIAFNRVADFLARRFGIALEQLHARHDHAGCAVSALQAVTLPKSLLHRMQLAIPGQPFNRSHFRAVRLHRQDRAGFDGLAIEQNRASAANAGFTAEVGAGQFALFAEEMRQERARFGFVLLLDPVDSNVDNRFHCPVGFLSC